MNFQGTTVDFTYFFPRPCFVQRFESSWRECWLACCTLWMELVGNRGFTLTTGNNKRSRPRRLNNSVPKGSVLAPLLFNIYTSEMSGVSYFTVQLHSGGSWWKWPGGLQNFISGWTYRIVALPLAVYNGVSSHSSSPNKLIKLVIFSCPYWYIENIHFSLIKPNPNPEHEHKRINPTGPIKSMTHNQCHQSCKGESRTQNHSNTKLGTFRSTTKVLLLIWQSLAFYSNRVMATDLGYSHFLWVGLASCSFKWSLNFPKKFKQFMILYKICFF